ncbi:MAG: ABC transporter permease [Bacteroidia bacterium]|nr:ABC transporter permease [Bacteroidia bacterium]
MIRNYLTTALRNLRRTPLYTGINILGLAVGITCFVLIVLFVRDEWSYDRYHSKADRIYRLVGKIDLEGQGEESSSNPFPVATTLMNDYPELIEHAVRFFDFQVEKRTLRVEEVKFSEPDIFFADSNVFQVFDFPLLKGNKNTALKGPNLIVISEEMAKRYFGDEDPVGKQMVYEGQTNLQVTGILGEIPPQSHFKFQALISFPTLRPFIGQTLEQNWVWNPNWTYLLLKKGVTPGELETQFPAFIQKYYPDFIKPQITHYLQPLTDIHLKSHLDYEIEPNSSETNIYIFLAIGIFILIIACINFMNLATARSAGRAREVGMRKVLGAYRGQVIGQFLGESLVMSFFAVILALFLISIFLPFFNDLSGKTLTQNQLLEPSFLLALVGLGGIVGFISGLYPAFYLSSFLPVKVLKGKLKSQPGDRLIRKGLVVTQFAISLALIISTMIIYRQFQFMQTAATGFTKDQIVVIPTKPVIVPKIEVFRENLLRNAKIQNLTTMNEIIGIHHNVHEYNYEGMEPGRWIYFPSLIVDEYFAPTFDLEFVAGRNFSKDHPTDDTLAIIVNETMVKERGWGTPEEALGQQLYTPRGRERVTGVVKDFHFVSLRDKIRPFVLDITTGGARSFFTKNIAVRISPGETDKTLAYIEEQWDILAPEHPFEYTFLDSQINDLYKDEGKLADLVQYFSVLAIFIACLGLFALASFTAEQRTKEIGIRKVLGSSVYQIVGLLAKDFILLVVIANLIAWPVAAGFMNNWLNGFAYRTDMSVGLFAIAGIGVTGIAFLTILFQSLKAGRADPIRALRED